MIRSLENVIGVISPGWALHRAIDRHNRDIVNQMLPGYKGGSQTRRRAQVSVSTAREDQALTGTYSNMIAAAMDLYRNEPMTRSIVDVVSAYIGESRPVAATGDPTFDAAATEYFNQYWWNIADARRRPGVDYGMLQHLWSKWCWLGGDMLFVLFDGSLYPYEGLQIQTPFDIRRDDQVINGVRIEKSPPHKITHYDVTNGNRLSYLHSAKDDFHRVRQSEAIFAPSKYWRPAMLRGVPELHAVIDALQDLGETNDDVQAKIKFDARVFTTERKGALGSGVGSRIINEIGRAHV